MLKPRIHEQQKSDIFLPSDQKRWASSPTNRSDGKIWPIIGNQISSIFGVNHLNDCGASAICCPMTYILEGNYRVGLYLKSFKIMCSGEKSMFFNETRL
jgi:hypothetical protein